MTESPPTWAQTPTPRQQISETAKISNGEVIDISDAVALESLAMAELVAIVQTAPRTISKIPAVKELLDRVKGKAPQSIAMTVKQDPVSQLSANDFQRLLAALPDPLIIPPMPSKLSTDNQ